MRKKITSNQIKVKDLYVNDFIRGFFGDQSEGKKMLHGMGLSQEHLPFSAAAFLQNKHTMWYDKFGNKMSISFKLKSDQIECFGTYMLLKRHDEYLKELQTNPKAHRFTQKKRSMRLFREWGVSEDAEKIARLESEAIGDCCMKCIYEILKE